MILNRQEINEDNILDTKTFEKVLKIEDYKTRQKAEEELYNISIDLKKKTKFATKYEAYKKIYLNKYNTLDFGEKAPIPKLLGGEYYIENNCIYNHQSKKVCSQLIEPIAIYENIEQEKEAIKCAFLKDGEWKTFISDRITLLHNGKIVNLTQKGVDVSTGNATLLVKYLQEILNLNRNVLEKKKSISRLGWYGDGFIPYDSEIEFDGEDNFRNSFNAICCKGDYKTWLEEMYKIRENKIVKILHATSFASVLLRKLNKKPFVTMIWGTTGDGKTVAGMSAMSIWGKPTSGDLMFTLNNTDNFYYRTANFFCDLPMLCDELETYRGDVNKLIMNITEGIDRGKAKADGGIERNKTWNNAFIMTGEHTASNYNSGGGTLNRLIEINSDGKIIENGSEVVDIITKNYGFAGKIFIEKIKQVDIETLNKIYKLEYQELLKFSNTEEKQALNMALILLADALACEFIFEKETPLEPKEVAKFMFTKDEIDVSQRAYEMILDECVLNKARFLLSDCNSLETPQGGYNGTGEFWGQINNYEITINKHKLQEILDKNGFSFKKTMKDWVKKGYVEKNSQGKNYTKTTVNGMKSYYVIIKKKGEDE